MQAFRNLYIKNCEGNVSHVFLHVDSLRMYPSMREKNSECEILMWILPDVYLLYHLTKIPVKQTHGRITYTQISKILCLFCNTIFRIVINFHVDCFNSKMIRTVFLTVLSLQTKCYPRRVSAFLTSVVLMCALNCGIYHSCYSESMYLRLAEQ